MLGQKKYAPRIAKNERKQHVNKQIDKISRRINHFRAEITKKWQAKGLTALISPVFPTGALKKEFAGYADEMFEYSGIWNLIGFPCVSFPVTQVLPNEQFFKDHYNDQWTQVLQKNSKDSKGLPVGLQIISCQNEDEKLLAIMKLIEQEMKIKVRPPRLSEESVNHFIIKDPRVTAMPSVQMTNFTFNRGTEIKSIKSTMNAEQERGTVSVDEEKVSLINAVSKKSPTVSQRNTEVNEEDEDGGSEPAPL